MKYVIPLCLSVLILLPLLASEENTPTYWPTEQYQDQTIEGWTVKVHSILLNDHPELAEKTLRLLQSHLYQITRMVPPKAVAKLKTIPIWVEYKDKNGKFPCMCYHPSPEWLRNNNYNPDKAGGVELANPENFLTWTKQQPWMVFHELAHGYHHQVLKYNNQQINNAFKRINEGDKYKSVLHINGRKEKAYALTNDQEYFAETSEAFFGTNDFFPFVQSELKGYDPEMYQILKEVWGT